MDDKYKSIDMQRTHYLLQHVPEVEAAAFNVSQELQKAIIAATTTIEGRTFSERHPELGKMVNCQVCRRRHRVNERKCEQVFTYTVKDKEGFLYERFREDEKGDVVPDYRTAIEPGTKPTMKQVVGRAGFVKKRFHPHPSKIKLLFIERVRKVFETLGFALEKAESQTPQEFQEQFKKDLQRARVVAARQIRKERRASSRAVRIMQDTSRRINRA